MNINFKIATLDGPVEQYGEPVEYNGFQYALHRYKGRYKATELSTGFCVISISDQEEADIARDYLIQQIKILTISPKVLDKVKEIMKRDKLPYPLNPKYAIRD